MSWQHPIQCCPNLVTLHVQCCHLLGNSTSLTQFPFKGDPYFGETTFTLAPHLFGRGTSSLVFPYLRQHLVQLCHYFVPLMLLFHVSKVCLMFSIMCHPLCGITFISLVSSHIVTHHFLVQQHPMSWGVLCSPQSSFRHHSHLFCLYDVLISMAILNISHLLFGVDSILYMMSLLIQLCSQS